MCLEFVSEFAARKESVLFAGTMALAFDGDAGWEVLEENAGGGLVDFLAASTAAEGEFFEQGGWRSTELAELLVDVCGV